MKRIFSTKFSIKTVLIVVFSVLTSLVIILMGGVLNQITSRHFVEMSYGYNEQLTSQAKYNLDTYFKDINQSLTSLAKDPALIALLKNNDSADTYQELSNRKSVLQQIYSIRVAKQELTDIMIFSEKSHVMSQDTAPNVRMNSPFLQQILSSYQNEEFVSVTYYPADYPSYCNPRPIEREIPISIVIRDYSVYDTTNYGVLLASLKTRHIDDLFSQMRDSGGFSAFIVDEQKNIFYSSDKSYLRKNIEDFKTEHNISTSSGSFLRDDKGKLVMLANIMPLEINNWQLVIVSDMSDLQVKLNTIQTVSVIVTIIGILLVIWMSYLVTSKVTSPLITMTNQMEQMDRNALNNKLISTHHLKEIDSLYISYNHMLDRIESLIDEVYYEKIRQKEAQYEALQSKINPHFLYNTLQSIHSLAVLERNSDVEEVTTALGDMLEYLIYEKSGQVYLSQELDYIKSYIKIQKLRYNNSFTADFTIQPACLKCVVHKLLIQPIVENAINHGFSQQPKGSTLSIRAWIDDDVLKISVEDSGQGISAQDLEKLNRQIRSSERDSKHKSIGLSNIQERIVLKYGEPYGLNIRSTQGVGTTVEVTVPADTNREEVDG